MRAATSSRRGSGSCCTACGASRWNIRPSAPSRTSRGSTPARLSWCAPTASASRAIRSDELVLLDLWGKLDRAGAVYADITWMGYTGRLIPDRYTEAFAAVGAARDAAITLVQRAAAGGQELRGWQVDRA